MRPLAGPLTPIEPQLPGAPRTAMMIKATDIRRGMVITIDGTNYVVVDFAHHTPGNLRAMVQTKLRNMNNGGLIDKRLRSVDQIEVPYVETKPYEYLYSSGDEHVFMDTETYDQLSFPPRSWARRCSTCCPTARSWSCTWATSPSRSTSPPRST